MIASTHTLHYSSAMWWRKEGELKVPAAATTALGQAPPVEYRRLATINAHLQDLGTQGVICLIDVGFLLLWYIIQAATHLVLKFLQNNWQLFLTASETPGFHLLGAVFFWLPLLYVALFTVRDVLVFVLRCLEEIILEGKRVFQSVRG